MDRMFVIVGASLAGGKAAETLRNEGFDGRVVLIGAEPERPYERPPLSKDLLLGKGSREQVFLHPAEWYAEHDIELLTSTRVAAIDRTAREVELASGERVGYDALLLSTGSQVRRLDAPGADANGVLYLRTLADSERIGAALREGARVEAVALTDGAGLPADTVVVGVGIRPATELAEAAGLEVDNGVLVDAAMRTSDPAVYAAGDVANRLHPLLGTRIRVEHWANALDGGPAAARAMLGLDAGFQNLPYFYTDQYDLGMEYAGHVEPGGYDRVVYRGTPGPDREFIAVWTSGGRLPAGLNVNVWDVSDAIQALVRSGKSIDPARLADPEIPLDELL